MPDREALQYVTDQITNGKQNHLDSLLIVLGDINRENLSHEHPKFRKHIKCPTRDTNILDHYKERLLLCSTCRFGTLWSLSGSSYPDLQAEIKIY